jgi:hypothetical protein
MSNSMEIRLLTAEIFCANERTDRRKDKHDEANSHFSQSLRTRQGMIKGTALPVTGLNWPRGWIEV